MSIEQAIREAVYEAMKVADISKLSWFPRNRVIK